MSEKIHKARGLEKDFVILRNKDVQRGDLSYEALGMLTYLMSLPSDWTVYVSSLERKGTGRDKVKRIVAELVANGYLYVEQGHDSDGKFTANEYYAYAMPEYNPHFNQTPLTEKPLTVEPQTANPQLQRKEVNKEKKEQKIADEPQKVLPVGNKLAEAKPYYDAIVEILDIHGGQNVDMQKMLEGTSKKKGYAEYNMNPAVSLEEFRRWGVLAKAEYKDYMIKAPAKVNGSITKTRQRRNQAVKPVTMPVSATPSVLQNLATDGVVQFNHARGN
jgi:hypothetical protein